jgi:hypothetical protein
MNSFRHALRAIATKILVQFPARSNRAAHKPITREFIADKNRIDMPKSSTEISTVSNPPSRELRKEACARIQKRAGKRNVLIPKRMVSE